MSPVNWQRGNSVRADLTLRCAGKRILTVLPGEPARVQGVRQVHSSGEYLLRDQAFVLEALATSDVGEVGPLEMATMSIECPGHKGGHYIGASKLRDELVEARRGGGDRGIPVERVVVPLDDGSAYNQG